MIALSAITFSACTGQFGNVEIDPEVSETGDPEPEDGTERAISATFAVGASVEVCRVRVGLNCRSGPSTGYRVLRVLPSGTTGSVTRRSGSWHRLDLSNGICWTHGNYLCSFSGSSPGANVPDTPDGPATPPPHPPSPPPGSTGTTGWKLPAPYHLTPEGIIATGRAFVGFSYWWGGARLPNPWAVSGKPRGRCTSATYRGHSGTYGADCSGFVGMIWQLPTAKSFETNSHPYSTYHFLNNRTYWSAVDRSTAKRGDAMVYRGSSGGHIFVTDSVSSWGKHQAVEARGCSYGIVYNLRSVSSKYRARRRSGL